MENPVPNQPVCSHISGWLAATAQFIIPYSQWEFQDPIRWRYHILRPMFLGYVFVGISPENMAQNMVLTNVPPMNRILKISH